VLRAFVQRGLFSADVAASMLAWPHSGFHVHNAVRIAGEDLRGTLQLARYAARAPLALARITYDATKQQVLLASDKSAGPTAGMHTFAPLEFLAQLLTHIPRQGEHLVRYYGAYASRTRGTWRRQGIGPWVERQHGEGDAEDEPAGAADDANADPGGAPVAPPPEPLPRRGPRSESAGRNSSVASTRSIR
jgi:Putative transposase